MERITHYAIIERFDSNRPGVALPMSEMDVTRQAWSVAEQRGECNGPTVRHDAVKVETLMRKGLWFREFPGRGRQSIAKVARAS